jgi:acyl-CoA reductase-like NAD-dependent aldehyde dehydrogenase
MIWEVPEMGVPETRRAIQYADAVLPAWCSRTAKERASILRRWFDLVMENQADLAAIMTAEQGKPLAESRSEIAYAASFIEWFGEEGKRVYGDTIPPFAVDKRIVVLKQPIGVCAAITPWNFPIAMITRKAGPALAAGCTMVVKPSSETPLSALALVYLAELAGAPHILDALQKGAHVAMGGKRHALGGTFFEPTVLVDATADMLIFKEENFGPVAPVFRFKNEDEAVRLANDTEFGLAAYFYSRDIGRIWRVGEALEYGMVGINDGIISTEVAPFGGIKQSGKGREGSKYGIEEYLETKYLSMGGIQ